MSGFYQTNTQNGLLYDLHGAITADKALNQAQIRFANQAVQQDLGGAPLNSPLASVLPRLGGGFLGYQVGKYMNMSMPGKLVTGAAGYGVGKLVSDFYQGYNNAMGSDTSWRMNNFAS